MTPELEAYIVRRAKQIRPDAPDTLAEILTLPLDHFGLDFFNEMAEAQIITPKQEDIDKFSTQITKKGKK